MSCPRIKWDVSRSFGFLYLHFCLEIVKSSPLRFGRCQIFFEICFRWWGSPGRQSDGLWEIEWIRWWVIFSLLIRLWEQTLFQCSVHGGKFKHWELDQKIKKIDKTQSVQICVECKMTITMCASSPNAYLLISLQVLLSRTSWTESTIERCEAKIPSTKITTYIIVTDSLWNVE